MLFRVIMVLSLTLFPINVSAQEFIDQMLAVVVRTVITQSDIKVVQTLHQNHPPALAILKERSLQSTLEFLVEVEIMYALAEGVPVYQIPKEEWLKAQESLAPLLKTELGKTHRDRFLYWLRLQIIAENYVQTNLGITEDYQGSIDDYQTWMADQKKRIRYRIVPEKKTDPHH